MKTIQSFLLALSLLLSISTANTLKLDDNIMFWLYATKSEKTCLIIDLIWVDRNQHEFRIDDNNGKGIYSEIQELSSCIDRRYYPYYVEFSGDVDVIHVALVCASERHWFVDFGGDL